MVWTEFTVVDCRPVIHITVQHGSADTVVRAINVKYRKWRLRVL